MINAGERIPSLKIFLSHLEKAVPGYVLTGEYFGEGERCKPTDTHSPPRIHLALLAVSLIVEN